MTKVSMGNLVKGLAFILLGMVAAILLWNVLLVMDLDVLYVSSKRSLYTQLVPIFCTVPGLILFIAWFFNKKGLGERTQLISTQLYQYAAFYIIGLALDAVMGVVGMVLIGFKYLTAGGIDLAIALVLQILVCWLAYSFCPPYSKN